MLLKWNQEAASGNLIPSNGTIARENKSSVEFFLHILMAHSSLYRQCVLYVLPFHFGGKYNIFKLKEVRIKFEIIVVKFTADYRAIKISIEIHCNHFFSFITCVAYNFRFNELQVAPSQLHAMIIFMNPCDMFNVVYDCTDSEIMR